MPESSLSLQLSDLAQAVGYFLGYNRTAALWTGWQAALPYVASTPDSQLADILTTIQAGLRQFYFHQPLPASQDTQGVMMPQLQPAHRWSFLAPERTLATVNGTSAYALPDDYQAFLGEMTYASPTSGNFFTVRQVSSVEVRRWLAAVNGAKAPPVNFAEVPYAADGSIGQRFGVVFYPIPDAAYTLTYRSSIFPAALTNANPFPYGGMLHSETILESCLAVAESRLNDTPEQEGVHAQRFQQLLQASIAQDTRDHWSELAGYNGDRSDRARALAAARNGSAASKKANPRLGVA